MVNIIVEELRQPPVDRLRVEMVERKGTGHPDTICDAIMEEVSVALCRAYMEAFGRILHHNADKAMLVAGRTRPRPGGGTVVEPMRFIFGDRATTEYRGKRIDVAAIAESAARKWVRDNLRHVDPDRHLVFQNEIKSGSAELTGIFERPVICANDTSAAVGYAPYTDTERLVIATERLLNSPEFKRRFPEAGEDVKVMGYRCDRLLSLTIAMAFVDRHVPDLPAYFNRKEEIRQAVLDDLAGREHSLSDINVEINTLDDRQRGEEGVYLTVLGTSAESGDCGQVGRGNKVNGVIALNRPMSMEAAAGKNPVSHVGKIYSLLAMQIADDIYRQVPGIAEVNIRLGSRIGQPVDRPAIVSAQLTLQDGMSLAEAEPRVAQIIRTGLQGTAEFSARLARGDFPVW